jgi:hypothetical protein
VTFHSKPTAIPHPVPHVEARTPELADGGFDFDQIAQLGGKKKARLCINQRHRNTVDRSDPGSGERECVLEQKPRTMIEELKETAVENNAGGIAVSPFDSELPAMREIAQAATC